MSRYRGRQIRMVGMPHDNMPSAFDDVKTIRPVQTAKVVLAPAKRRLTHAGQEFMFSCHRSKLSIEQHIDARRGQLLTLRRERYSLSQTQMALRRRHLL